MPEKIFRDPLYNYISIDRKRDGWLLKLLDCPEVQRLRRIHQLGVSHFTYPGADHNRLLHSLGVVHLMLAVLRHLENTADRGAIETARPALLAAALLHDVGHGPYSHLFEPCLGIDHEQWSMRIILDPESSVHKVLRKHSVYLPQHVADLIDSDNNEHPAWQKSLLSSQLDVDRLDYLRRDSLFTGAGYGHFDWFRILNTVELIDVGGGTLDLVWPERAAFAIEEYIFARYYMYQNVYLHKTTRGFEALLQAMWRRGRQHFDAGSQADSVLAIREFWAAEKPTCAQYLRIEEYTVLQQIQAWQDHTDSALSDLARRFLTRDGFVRIKPPPPKNELSMDDPEWEDALRGIVTNAGFDPPEMYCLADTLKAKYKRPYQPEREGDEQSVRNAIRIIDPESGTPVEISRLMKRLGPITKTDVDQRVYYVPKAVRDEAKELAATWPK